MELKALITIKYGGRYHGPGQVFDCDDFDTVQYLIKQAAAIAIEPTSASGKGISGGPESVPAEAGTRPEPAGLTAEPVVKRQIQVSEPQATTGPRVTIPAGDPGSWTKKQIKEALDQLGVEYDGRVGKAKLLMLYQGARS